MDLFCCYRSNMAARYPSRTTSRTRWRLSTTAAWRSAAGPSSSWSMMSRRRAASWGQQIQKTHWTLFELALYSLNQSELCPFLLRWQFASDGADIGFGVYRRTAEGKSQKVSEMLQVLPSERYNAHLVPEDSCLTCPEPGVCEWQHLNVESLQEGGSLENIL